MNQFRKQEEFLWGSDARELLEQEDQMGRLLANEDFKVLAAIGKKQAQTRVDILLSPASRPAGPSDEFLKGAIYGITLLLETPKIIMEQAKQVRQERAEEIEDVS